MVNNRLFLLCPDSHLEMVVRRKFNGNHYFLTALGGIFDVSNYAFTGALIEFISLRAIREICIVNDTSSRFIKSVLQKEGGFNTKAERFVEDIYTIHFREINALQLRFRSLRLAEIIVQNQVEAFLKDQLMSQCLVQQGIPIRGLVYHRRQNVFINVCTHDVLS